MNRSPFIDEPLIHRLLQEQKEVSEQEVRGVLERALRLKGLNLEDAATLLYISDPHLVQELFSTASRIKQEIYGKRLVLFAPLYVSNNCTNNCLYCGFRTDNNDMNRRCLSIPEVEEEILILLEQGHKRTLMLMGEDPSSCSFQHFLDCIEAAYRVRDSKGSGIRRVNVEIAPLTDEEFRQLARVKIGTYTVFQETYHQDTYRLMHPSGKKSDYLWRLTTMDRALTNGLHDVGIGALFGLYDHRFEVLALLQHARHLDWTYGVGPHTISIPRIEYAQNAPCAMKIPRPVSDQEFMKLVAVLRCAVPYTGIILSTREPPEMRNRLFDLGVSQISAGSKTSPGGYQELIINPEAEAQFSVSDTRSTGDVIRSVIEQGYVPSFCTGCYRLGRVGQDFMELAKPGLIKMHCLPNALLTLKEYLTDYADETTKIKGEQLIKEQLDGVPDEDRRHRTEEALLRIEHGERDIYF